MNKEELVISLIDRLVGEEKPVVNRTGYEKYIGKNVLIRTVTHHYTGAVTDVTGLTLNIENAAWLADSGRFHEFLKDPDNANEVEPYPNPVTINLYSILDVTEIPKYLVDVK